MKLYRIILLCLVGLILQTCMVDRDLENSFLFERIAKVELSTTTSIFIQEARTQQVDVQIRYFDHQGSEILPDVGMSPELYINSQKVDQFEVDLSSTGTYNLNVLLPNGIESNRLPIEVYSLIDGIETIDIKAKNGGNIFQYEQQGILEDYIEATVTLVTGEQVELFALGLDYSIAFDSLDIAKSTDIQELPVGIFNVQVSINDHQSNKVVISVYDLISAIETIEIEWIHPKGYILQFEDTGILEDVVLTKIGLINGQIMDVKTAGLDYHFEIGENKIVSNTTFENLPIGLNDTKLIIGSNISNTIEVWIRNPEEEIDRIDLDFSVFNRNEYAIADFSKFDFEMSVIAKNGDEFSLKNYSLFVNNQRHATLEEIPISDIGENRVRIETYGKSSNNLIIRARQEQQFETVRIPVVFHVFPNAEPISDELVKTNMNDLNQAFSNKFQPDILKSVNAVDSKIEFFLAEFDEFGVLLPELGINRLTVHTESFVFPSTDSQRNLLFDLMWDPSLYLNVFVSEVESGFSSAWGPWISGSSLEGVSTVSQTQRLTYPYVTVMSIQGMNSGTQNAFAHEIGHMLALPHTFEDCGRGDFSDDTEPHYIRSGEHDFNNIRTNCSGQVFHSTNFMDYLRSAATFTYDQRRRMRTVIEHCPFLPVNRPGVAGRTIPFEKGTFDPTILPVENCGSVEQ